MSVKFVWTDDYATGISELDNQHMKIFELGNNISDIDSKNQVKKAIMSLYQHTRTHFGFEEELMRKSGYPDWEKHKEGHDDLINELNKVGEKAANGNLSIQEFKKFVYCWIIDHIIYQDKLFIDYYKERNGA